MLSRVVGTIQLLLLPREVQILGVVGNVDESPFKEELLSKLQDDASPLPDVLSPSDVVRGPA